MRRLAAMLLFSAPLFAGPTSWTSNGPSGGTIWDIEYDRTNPSIVYAATEGALFRSSNGGEAWSPVAGTPTGTVITAVEIDPANSSILYISTERKGVWKTINAGTTWSSASDGLPEYSAYPDEYYPVHSIAVSPANGSILYAGASQYIYKSIDGGGSWSLTGSLPTYTPVVALAIDPNATDTIYAGMQGDKYSGGADGVYKSVNGGTVWTATTNSHFYYWHPGGSKVIWDIEIDPSTTPSAVYVAYDAGGLAKSTDGGLNWDEAKWNGTVEAFKRGYSVEIASSSPSTVFVGSENSIQKSTNGGTSWTTHTAGLAGIFFAALAVNPIDPQKITTGNNSELLGSGDGGASWDGVSGINSGVIDSMAYNSVTGSLLGIGSDAVFRSSNNGASWSMVSRFGGRRAPSLVSQGGVFYALTWEGGCRFSIEKGAKFAKSVDNGANWTFQVLGTASRGRSIAVHPANANIIYVTLDSLYSGEPPMMKTVDGGTNWTNINFTFTSSEPGPIAFHPTNTSIIYTGSNAGVYKSIDAGVTWVKKINGLPGNYMDAITAITIDPANANHVFAGSRTTLYESMDGGENWTSIVVVDAEDIYSGYGELWATSILFDPITAGTVYLSTRRYGVFRSTNSGQTWLPYNSNLSDTRITKLVSGASGFLHASTGGSGIFDIGGAAPLPAPVLTATYAGAAVSVSWTYSGPPTQFQLERSFGNQSYATIATVSGTSHGDSGVSTGTTYLYRVRPVGSVSVSNVDHATVLTFSDDPLSAESTIVKAAHLTELRNAANAMRAAVGLPSQTFSPAASPGLTIQSDHITELRTALGAALTSLGRTTSFTDTAAVGTSARAVHFQELRTAVE